LVAEVGDQVQAKVVLTNGGFYLSWFSSTGGYDVYVQRFDELGNPVWKNGGVMVADRNFSSTQGTHKRIAFFVLPYSVPTRILFCLNVFLLSGIMLSLLLYILSSLASISSNIISSNISTSHP
jgi:hypothetical protein